MLAFDEQHDYMANHLAELFTAALAEFDGHKQHNDYYWYLAWGGLRETRLYKQYDPSQGGSYAQNSSDKPSDLRHAFTKSVLDSIELVNSIEKSNLSGAKGQLLDTNGDCYD